MEATHQLRFLSSQEGELEKPSNKPSFHFFFLAPNWLLERYRGCFLFLLYPFLVFKQRLAHRVMDSWMNAHHIEEWCLWNLSSQYRNFLLMFVESILWDHLKNDSTLEDLLRNQTVYFLLISKCSLNTSNLSLKRQGPKKSKLWNSNNGVSRKIFWTPPPFSKL